MKLWSALKRKYRQDHETFPSQDDDVDGELPAILTSRMRSKAIPLDLSLPAGSESENDDLLMRATPQETLTSTLSNGRQSPVSRLSQVNGQHSPTTRPAALPSTPKGGDRSLNSSFNKKRGSNWFSLSYKQKSEEFHKLFKDIPADERLLVDYSCAMQKDILVHGRLYISQNWICFYANILFKWETTVMIPCKQIKSITKEKTARVIPNAIQINTNSDKFFFSSFGSRDKTYLMMFRVWQNFLLEKLLSNQQLWQWVHRLYGHQLGLTASDDDYQSPDCAHDSDNATTPDISSVAGSDVTVERAGLASPSSGTFEPTQDVDGQAGSDQHDLSTDGTDLSGTEDACEEGEVECPAGHEHADWVTLDLLVNFSVDELFKLLFSDNAFFRSFLDSQGTTDVELGDWSEEPDADGVRHRSNTFTIAVNASFGPKSTASSEKQKMQKESKPGSFYCIDCESFTDPSLPYGENFYVWNRYCISRVSKSTCRVTARTKICYVKSVFSLVKAIIEKNVRNGINSYFKPLMETLTLESDRMATTVDQKRKKKRYTKHRVASAHSRVANRPSNGAVSGVKATQGPTQLTELNSSRKASYLSSTVRVMSALLIFLVMFNLLLFFKLWSLETRHAAMQYDSTNSGLYSHQDLLELLNKQKFLYDKDMDHWKTTLESSTKLIEQLQQSIEEIKAQQAASTSHLPANSAGAWPTATEVKTDL